MIHIEQLDNGVLFIRNGSTAGYEATVDSLAAPIKDKYQLLCAADKHVRIEGVGVRISETVFWIFTEGDYDKDGVLTPRSKREIGFALNDTIMHGRRWEDIFGGFNRRK